MAIEDNSHVQGFVAIDGNDSQKHPLDIDPEYVMGYPRSSGSSVTLAERLDTLVSMGGTQTITGEKTFTAPISGTISVAEKLQTARNLGVALDGSAAAPFDGSANQLSIPVSGTLPIANGGTGATAVADIQAGKDGDGNTITSTYATKADVADEMATKANIDGNYPDMTVGNAEQLLSDDYVADTAPYTFRKAGGGVDVGDREFDKLVGGTIAWNQLVAKTSIMNDGSGQGLTWSIDTDGTVHFNGTSEGRINLFQVNTGQVYKGHVYFIHGLGLNVHSSGWYVSPTSIYSNPLPEFMILKSTNTETAVWLSCEVMNSGLTFNNVSGKFWVCDLTAMFGTAIADYIYALEQATPGAGVAWFRAHFSKDYYAYDAGSLQSVQAASHDMVGFNQWDEEWELGSIDASGENTPATDRIRSKNYTEVFGDTTYCLNLPAPMIVHLWDIEMSYIGNYWYNTGVRTFTLPANARYLKFRMDTAYGTTYKHDICINLSWSGYRNGEYEPYEKHSYPLDSTLTLRGIPKLDASNNLYYDGDTYASDGTVTRKYGIRAYQEGDVTDGSTMITDGANTVYLLDTPTTETADAFQTPQIVNDFGTEQYVDAAVAAGTRDVAIPVGHDTRYTQNLRDKLRRLPNMPDSDGVYNVLYTGRQCEFIAATDAASDATPQPLGVAAAGTDTNYARADHVHTLPAQIAINAADIASLNGKSYQEKCFEAATTFTSGIGGNIYKCTEKVIPANAILTSVEVQTVTSNSSGYIFLVNEDDTIVDKIYVPSTTVGWNTISINKRYTEDVYVCIRYMQTGYIYTTSPTDNMFSVGLMECSGDTYGGRVPGQTLPFTQNVPDRYYQFGVKINYTTIGISGLINETLGVSKPSDFVLPQMEKTGEQGYSLFGKWYKMTETQSECANCGGASIAFKVKGATSVSVDIEQLVFHDDPAYMMTEEPYIAYSVDGAAFTRVQIATDSESSVKTISIPSTAEHFVWIVIDGMCQSSGGANRSTGWSGVYIKSLTSNGTMYKVRPKGKQILYVGDSMVEGINTLGSNSLSSSNSNTAEWTFKSALDLHAFPLMQGYGGSTTWTGENFELYSRPDYLQDTYIVDNKPDVIVCEYGHNDYSLVYAGTQTEAEFITQYRTLIADLTAHYPGIPVVIIIPFKQVLTNAIRSVASTYPYYYLVETYGYDYQTTDGSHPNAASGTAMGANFADDMIRIFGKQFFD